MPTYIDIHIIQTVPPSNLNRDDTGSPKSAFFGGVRRVRVSSQAWKRAVRMAYQSLLDSQDLGVRTKRAAELLAARITEIEPDTGPEEASQKAVSVLQALGVKTEKKASKTKQKAIDAGESTDVHPSTDYLIFWSNRQLDRLARLAVDAPKPSKREAVAAADAEHGIDVALFGRMVADDADLNVDACVQVAHALSTHAAEIEQDYFTAVDDRNVGSNETGAGMIGTVEFNAATLYRYATVNVGQLAENLGGDVEATARAVEAFVRGFAISMPTGKQNTFAHRTLPDAVAVAIRDDQPVSLVRAFEQPVAPAPEAGGYVTGSVERLTEEAASVQSFIGAPRRWLTAHSTPAAARVTVLSESVALDDLVREVVRELRNGDQAGS